MRLYAHLSSWVNIAVPHDFLQHALLKKKHGCPQCGKRKRQFNVATKRNSGKIRIISKQAGCEKTLSSPKNSLPPEESAEFVEIMRRLKSDAAWS
jgi:hypothetical protein